MAGFRNKLCSLCVSLVVWAPVLSGEPPTVEHNPFARPTIEEGRLNPTATNGDSGQGGDFELKATLVSSQHQYANVDGQVLRPGEAIYGYTLKKVLENRAVFEKNGIRTTVYVKPEIEENNDPRARNRNND